MKMHPQVIGKILYLCTNYGGHTSEKKLVAELNQLRLSPYQVEQLGLVLVDSRTFISERQARNLPINDIVPMKFHGTVIQKVMYAYNMYSGHTNESKLRNALIELDLTPYERKEVGSEIVLVPTSDYMKTLQGTGQ